MKYAFSLLCFCFLVGASAADPEPRPDPGGDDVGNGGDVVFCPADSFEMLDLYEAREIYKFTADLEGLSGSLLEDVQNVFRRLESFDPSLAQRYQKRAASFLDEAAFLKNRIFQDIKDSNHIPLPMKCAIAQIAIQNEPQLLGEPTYLVSDDLWERMDHRNRVALVIHEIVFREALGHGHTNSKFARYFTGLLTSTQWAGLDEATYQDMSLRFGMDKIMVQDQTRTTPETWILSHEEFAGAADAIKYCASHGAEIQVDEAVQRALSFLRNSIIGRYYIPSLGTLKVWGQATPWMGYVGFDLTHMRDLALNTTEGVPRHALCRKRG